MTVPAMRVLYVEDDRVQALLFGEVCRLAPGIEFENAADGAEALELAASFEPELLVVDLHLPDTDGCALLPRLRAALPRPVPAVLCTADPPEAVADRAAAAGFDGCWSKPIELPTLLAELQRRAAPTR